jgi:serine protease DegQ
LVLPTRHRLSAALVFLLLAAFVASACNDDGNAVTAPDTETEDTANGPEVVREGAPEAVEGGDLFARIPEIVSEVEPSVVALILDVGAGSGVVWDSDGRIVTNHHVVEAANDIQVGFADGRRVPATVLASDPLTDLAIIEVDREGLPPAEFAAELPRVGALAIAMGNPLGFENSVTVGIVSGLNRSIPGSARSTQALIDLIQTDAAISPGNSGGALIDGNGRVIGINVAYIPPQARAVAIGFAIPSPTVVDVIGQLLETGTVSHVFFGVQPAPLTPQIARRLDAGVERGVVVLELVPGGPAEEAGVQPGDVLTELDGEPVRSVENFLASLRGRSPGDVVDVRLLRAGEEVELSVTLSDRPPAG